jgi:hypothetical protein
LFDVGHGFGVKIQPDVAEDELPAPADELMDDNENPNREMIDLSAHDRLDLPPAAVYMASQ